MTIRATLRPPSAWIAGVAIIVTACASGGGTFSVPAVPEFTAASFAPVSVDRFAGEWVGVYYAYPEPMSLKLSLRQTGARSVEGEVQFEALTDSRSAVRAAAGRYTVRGEFDPALRSFALEPQAWIERSRRPVTLSALEGVMDADGGGLAGLFGGRTAGQYFALRRPDRARELTDPMIAAVSGRAGASIFARGTPADEVLLRWASKLTDEHPDVDPRRTQLGPLYTMAVNLFEDGHFAAHFGTTFDRLSATQRSAIAARFRTTVSTARPGTLKAVMDRRPDEALRQYSALSRAFSAQGTQGTPEVVHAVLAQRIIRSWRMLHLARVERLPASTGAIDELDRLQEAGRTRLRTLWPSDRVAFDRAVDDARRRLAGPVLIANAEQAVATAAGYEGARMLAAWQAANQRLLGLAPAAQRDAATRHVDGRLHEMLAPLIAEETAGLARLGRGMPAVAAGNLWYSRFQARYGFASRHPAYQAAVRQLTELRPTHLGQARTDVISALDQIARADDIDRAVSDILAVPGDRQTAAGRAIVAAADARKADIRRRQQSLGAVALSAFCHLGLSDANERRALVSAAFWGTCRKLATEQVVRLNRPDLSPHEAADVAGYILQFVDGDFAGLVTGRQSIVDEITGELRRRHPQRTWDRVAIEALLEAVYVQAGSR